jgi:protein-S-isoprenylcysteine O-methyltransferase Ste14
MCDSPVSQEGKRTRLLRIEPPFYLFLSLATILLLHLFLPGATAISAPWNLLGVVFLSLGIVLNLMADRSFKECETSVKPLGDTTTLVTTGAFRVSRHPMYLGFVLILLGAAVLAGSATPFLVVAMFFGFIDTVFVRFEEEKLSRTFGTTWSAYTANVRRWV